MLFPAFIGGKRKISCVLSASTANFNLNSWLTTYGGWNGSSPVEVTVTINGGVIVGSNSTGTPAFYVGSFPANSKVTITNYGRIEGAGGQGGNANPSVCSGGVGGTGGTGGTALQLSFPTTIYNYSQIWGGGGGGGGAGSGHMNSNAGCGGGGGGAGWPLAGGGGSGGSGGCKSGSPGAAGAGGGDTWGGSGGGGGIGGGAGGGPGAAGAQGGYSSGLGGGGPGAAGAAGYGIYGNGYATWAVNTDYRGRTA